MTKPLIICRTNYKLSLNNLDRVNNSTSKDIQYVSKVLDYYSDDRKRALNMIDYFTGKINKNEDYNLVLENGKYANIDELNKRKKTINKLFENSNLWQMVISFDKKYIDKNIKWQDLELKMAKEILPKFFKNMGFDDPKNMCYEFSLHTNTDNPHFHIAFMEKRPNVITSNGKHVYMKKGKINKNSIDYLKSEIILSIERESKFKPMVKNINENIEEFKSYFDNSSKNFIMYNKNNVLLEEKILKLGKILYESNDNTNNRIKYNSIKDNSIKKLTEDIKNDLLSNYKLIIKKEELNSSLNQLRDYLNNISTNNHIKTKNQIYIKNKKEYINNYILNSIVNYSRIHYKILNNKRISKNDIIHSIILSVYKSNMSYTRKAIIDNSLNNKYKLSLEIIEAVKNINREMEKVAEEFYGNLQLFK